MSKPSPCGLKMMLLQPCLLQLVMMFTLTLSVVRGDNRVECPSDPTILGYVSIADVNDDIRTELDSITTDPLVDPQSEYIYTLCPHTVFPFNGTDRLTPVLNNSVIICGSNGDSSDRCIISGGDAQVLITNTPYIALEYLSFRGIIFANAVGTSIAAAANASTTAEFFDCHWKNGTGSSSASSSAISIKYTEFGTRKATNRDISPNAIDTVVVGDSNVFYHGTERRRLQSDVPLGMHVSVYDSSITGGKLQGAGGTYRAVYNSGYLYFRNVLIADNEGTIFTNLVGGYATIEDSQFYRNKVMTVIRPTNNSSLIVRNTQFFGNEGLGVATIIDSSATFEGCTFLDNDTPSGSTFLIFGSNVTLSNSCLVDGSSLTPIFVDGDSSFVFNNTFGQGQNVSEYCASPMGVFYEDTAGEDCLQNGECNGTCVAFDADTCAFGELTFPPTGSPSQSPSMAPTSPVGADSNNPAPSSPPSSGAFCLRLFVGSPFIGASALLLFMLLK